MPGRLPRASYNVFHSPEGSRELLFTVFHSPEGSREPLRTVFYAKRGSREPHIPCFMPKEAPESLIIPVFMPGEAPESLPTLGICLLPTMVCIPPCIYASLASLCRYPCTPSDTLVGAVHTTGPVCTPSGLPNVHF